MRTARAGAHRLGGPSLTALFRSFLSREPALVRRIEEEAWCAAGRPGATAFRDALRIEDSIRFVHGLPPRDGALSDRFLSLGGGAVVYRVTCSRYANNYMDRLSAPLDEWVGDSPPRSPPAPDAASLLLLLGPVAPARSDGRAEGETMDLAPALGELCATDDAAFAEVLRRAAAAPDDAALLVALGWSRRPAAAEFLAAQVRRLAPAVPWGPLPIAVWALGQADAAAIDKVIAALSDDEADRVLSWLDPDRFARRRLAAVEAAAGPVARTAALRRFCAAGHHFGLLPAGRDSAGFVRVLLSCIDSGDGPLREAALHVGDELLLGPPPDVFNAEWLPAGAFAGTETLLRTLLTDLTEGRIEVRDEEPGLFEPRPELFAPRPGVHGGPPESARTDARREGPLPLHLSGRWSGEGLVLLFRNDGDRPLAIDTVGLVYGTANVHRPREFREGTMSLGAATGLSLHFGALLSYPLRRLAVPARCLTILAPGAVRECVVPMRPDLRGVKQVYVDSCHGVPAVIGDSDAPLVRFGGTALF